MAEFVFWWDETITYKAGFEADSLEDAMKQLDETFNSGLGLTDKSHLTGYWSKLKGYEATYDPDTLEEIKETE